MSRILASAPGKAVLLGEYAVLDGAPALSLAINRRARVELRPAADRYGLIEVPQLGIEPIAFTLAENGLIEWRCSSESWAKFRRTGAIIGYLVAHARHRFGSLAPFHARIDTGELFSGKVKLGLGSSAAVAVAVDAAMTAHASGRRAQESPAAVLERLLPVYRSSQGGHGSGIDLASSLYGGLIGYRLAGERPVVERLEWPEDLSLMFLWTGTAASTPDMVAAWRRWQRAHGEQARGLLVDMRQACDDGLAAVRAGHGQELARLLGVYGHILGTMSSIAGISVVTEAHRRAMGLAERLGVSCKPCGAGGGDLGVAATTDSRSLAALAEELAGCGLDTIPLERDRNGVQLTMA